MSFVQYRLHLNVSDINIVCLMIDILVFLFVIVSTAIITQWLVRNKFQVGLKHVFLMQFVFILFFSLRYSTHKIISSPWWEDWYIEMPIGIGICCTYYVAAYFVLKKISLIVGDFRSQNVGTPKKAKPKQVASSHKHFSGGSDDARQ